MKTQIGEPRIEVTRQVSGVWIWRLQMGTGRFIAQSAERFVSKRDCQKSVEMFVETITEVVRRLLATDGKSIEELKK